MNKSVQSAASEVPSDRPIKRAEHDQLDRLPLVENLARALVQEKTDTHGTVVGRASTGVVIGLTGRWGSGKSSVLNLLSEHFGKMDDVVVATFNPWLVKDRDDLFRSFFSQLRDALGKCANEHVHVVAGCLARYEKALSFAILSTAAVVDVIAPGVGTVAAKPLVDALGAAPEPTLLSPVDERKTLESKLSNAKVAVVVLIDELDRVDDDDVRVVAQLVKSVGDIEGISYLVAYDPDRVIDALGRGEQRRQSGEEYLAKIIQHPVPLRPLFARDVSVLLDSAFQQHGIEIAPQRSEDEEKLFSLIRNSIKTPRELKRLVGCYVVIDRMVRSEICAADLLGYCFLLTKAPAIRDAIAEHPDSVVDDPDVDEITSRAMKQIGGASPNLSDAIGVPIGVHETLLKHLFPYFGSSRSADFGDRLCRRRNLLRVLYLGDPPGVVRSETVFELWQETDAIKLTIEFMQLIATAQLRPILDRLDDLLPSLPESGDVRFFCTLAQALIRNTDWLIMPEDNRAIAEEAAIHLMQLGLRDKRMVPRVRSVLAALEKADDLVILPFVLRKHLFHWGLTVHDKQPSSGTFLLDRSETEALSLRTRPLIRDSLLNGKLIRRVPTSEAMFALLNRDMWDQELRVSLTTQLEVPDARRSFAALIVPPGFLIDRMTLDLLIDAERVLAAMQQSNEGISANTWSDQCLCRLRAVLRGEDPTFIDISRDYDGYRGKK
jgi:hypothetical protein